MQNVKYRVLDQRKDVKIHRGEECWLKNKVKRTINRKRNVKISIEK